MTVPLPSKLAWGWCVGVLILYCIACATPAIDFGPKTHVHQMNAGEAPGWHALALGWVNLVVLASPEGDWTMKLSMVAWLANPIGLVSLILLACRVPIPAFVTGLVATWLSVWFLIFPYEKPLVGAYLWAASAGLLVVGSVVVLLVGKLVGPTHSQ